MYAPLALFNLREWATHREEGHVCPSCSTGHLVTVVERKRSYLKCDTCELDYVRAGWYRHFWASQAPVAIGGQAIGVGPLFATIQHWVSEPGEDPNQLQLADFYLDIDREDFNDAVFAAQAYARYFTRHGVPFTAGFSGKKGFWLQVPWQVMGATAMPMLHERVYRRVAQQLQREVGETLDIRLYTPSRMFRVVNTRHGSSGLYKVTIPDANDFPQARELAEKPSHPWVSLDLHRNDHMHELLTHAVVENHEVTEREKHAPLDRARLTLADTGAHTPCIDEALQAGPPTVGTRNLLNINMAAYFIDQDEKFLMEWARNVPGASKTPTSERVRQMQGTVRWAKKNRAQFSCHVMQEMSLCDPSCPFYPLSGRSEPGI